MYSLNNYIEQNIRAITNPWNLQNLVQNATPKLIELIVPTQLKADSAQLEKDLGHLTLYKVATGSLQGLPIFNILESFMRFIAKKDDLEASKNLLLAEFASESDFEKGAAKFDFQLLNRGEGWLINYLVITATSTNNSEHKILTLGEKTSYASLVEENKKKLELERLL
jgi:hypothetical protein